MNATDPKNDEVTLELLNAIEQRSDVSQRHLADKLGIALGLTNSYIRRCARKGYVKIKEVPANRYLYYLTPKGFAEKSRLTARFLATSLHFYRESAESCSELFDLCEQRQWRRVVLCGVSDLAEIAFMRAAAYSFEVPCIYDPRYKKQEFLSLLPARRELPKTRADQAYLVTGLSDPLRMYHDVLTQVNDKERVLVPRVLNLEAAIKLV